MLLLCHYALLIQHNTHTQKWLLQNGYSTCTSSLYCIHIYMYTNIHILAHTSYQTLH